MRRATFTVVMMSRPISLSLSRRFSLLGQLNSALRLFLQKLTTKNKAMKNPGIICFPKLHDDSFTK